MTYPTISVGIPAREQEWSFMNATLSFHDGNLAVSIAVHPNLPAGVETEADVADYLREELKALTQIGWDVEIQIGPDDD